MLRGGADAQGWDWAQREGRNVASRGVGLEGRGCFYLRTDQVVYLVNGSSAWEREEDICGILGLYCRRRNFEDVDAAEQFSLDVGVEWPDSEDPGVARYRLFFQNWIGIVQGNYPVNKKTAIRLAGLLTLIYHGDRNTQFWCPKNFK